MKAIFASGAVIALALSFLFPVSWALLWQTPLLFAAASLSVALLYWLFLSTFGTKRWFPFLRGTRLP